MQMAKPYFLNPILLNKKYDKMQLRQQSKSDDLK